MTTAFSCTVPQPDGGNQNLDIETGRSIIIIGANGSGKTRLGVYLENALTAQSVHRISAQKSLALNDNLSIISLERANNLLWYGTPDGSDVHKPGNRWGGKPATFPLSDFDALLQTLFAAHNRIASQHLEERRVRPDILVPTTQLDRLKTIWSELLPHRTLEVHEASIKVRSPQGHNGASYAGSEMSDGERAIFYMRGFGRNKSLDWAGNTAGDAVNCSGNHGYRPSSPPSPSFKRDEWRPPDLFTRYGPFSHESL